MSRGDWLFPLMVCCIVFALGVLLGAWFMSLSWQHDAIDRGYGQYVLESPYSTESVFKWNDQLETE